MFILILHYWKYETLLYFSTKSTSFSTHFGKLMLIVVLLSTQSIGFTTRSMPKIVDLCDCWLHCLDICFVSRLKWNTYVSSAVIMRVKNSFLSSCHLKKPASTSCGVISKINMFQFFSERYFHCTIKTPRNLSDTFMNGNSPALKHISEHQ